MAMSTMRLYIISESLKLFVLSLHKVPTDNYSSNSTNEQGGPAFQATLNNSQAAIYRSREQITNTQRQRNNQHLQIGQGILRLNESRGTFLDLLGVFFPVFGLVLAGFPKPYGCFEKHQ